VLSTKEGKKYGNIIAQQRYIHSSYPILQNAMQHLQ